MSRFCPAPWISISTDVNGSIRPCCRYEQPSRQTVHKMPYMTEGRIDHLYNGPEMTELREAFLRGEEPNECNWCWAEEAAGIRSFRQKYLERKYQFELEKPQPQILDLKLSNVCNLRCRMCGPQASSAIAKENGISNDYWLTQKIMDTKNESVLFDEWLPGIREIELTGGEPFFSPENKKLLTRIAETPYAANINLLITTNGMFYIPKLMESLKAFNRVQISLSVDDIGPRLEYARDRSSWGKIQSNILKMKENYPDFHYAIYRTVNNYNIWYLKDLEDWAAKYEITLANGFLHEPKSLSIRHLPDYVKEEIILSDAISQDIPNFLKMESNPDSILEFRKLTLDLDKKRGQSFVDTFPEWKEILGW